ncbi:MAG: cyclase family protein [ANME-2 cluster archaeon]|nr:cyclase family protein [ANME-2 cluster archaeon]MBC2701831.1 cyclase family protein [ANME-2 cluster archaeon]MBC2706725.1 cyclase family protein [ANME-2 cluster archaeon]MBC2747953.1 cyclase family protein [ANME-2 cluster archaeon]MBC2763126.1 cyclase family protein [ANME-2 cluster archaeon]
MKMIDISRTIKVDMEMYPGDTGPQITKVSGLDEGDSYNISRITLGTHTGTHVDPPLHLIRDGAGIDSLPMNTLVGNARVLDLSSINRPIEAGDIGPFEAGEIILLKGGSGDSSGSDGPGGLDGSADSGSSGDPGTSGGAYLTAACARYLVDIGIKTIGTDAISIGALDEEYEVHHTLLDAGIVVIEGLEMTDVEAGDYFLVCLPLKIANGDGGPARAVLIKEKE